MKIGDYIRTTDGLIAKIINIDNTSQYSEIILKTDTNDTIWCSYEKDLKSSTNIIDLIEKGDYVNGKKVTKTNLDKIMNGETAILCGDSNYDYLDVIYKNCNIKSIVTKEQFESMEYRIGE